MVNTYDNYKFALLTPMDYDKDTVFTNVNVVNNNGINIYKKLFNINYNTYFDFNIFVVTINGPTFWV